ncbi:MAG: ASPIC/UnbV domain-containing protein [Planctomycetales bacterium]|jgi:Flp pilus assembly protein TadD/thiol-disulfide isomerase/thioredoxin
MNQVQKGGSWSGHERNCCFLNTGLTRFANVSGISGLDFPDDSRCVAPVDWDHDGDLDMWLSARTGPTLRFVRNNGTDGHNFVAFRLEGTSCNRNAIGARIEVATGNEKLIRTAHAGDGYLSQASKWIHFGLGINESIDRVKVRWPGGNSEEFSGITVDGLFLLRQGTSKAETWHPPQRTVVLTPSRLDTVKAERATRITIRDRIPMADIQYETLNGETVSALPMNERPTESGAVLINLWATWCLPCLAELKEFSQKENELKAAGIDIIALNVEAASEGGEEAIPKARTLLSDTLSFPFRAGFATPVMLEKIDALQEVLISLRPAPGQLPSSFLIDRFGRLRAIYQGTVTVDQLIKDVRRFAASSTDSTDSSLPMPGRWINEPDQSSHVLAELSKEFRKRGIMDEALRFGSLAADVTSRHGVLKDERLDLASMFFGAGVTHLQEQHVAEAVRNLQEAVRMRPNWAEAHTNLAVASQMQHRMRVAEEHFIRAVQLKPNLLQPHFGLGLLYLDAKQLDKAAEHLQATIQLQPDFAEGYHHLGITLLRLGRRQEGVSRLRQAVGIDPGNLDARANLRKTLAGQTP